jgi:hypothetical protein
MGMEMEMSKELIEKLRTGGDEVFSTRQKLAFANRVEELECQLDESEYNNRGLVELYLEHRDQLAERDAEISALHEELDRAYQRLKGWQEKNAQIALLREALSDFYNAWAAGRNSVAVTAIETAKALAAEGEK